MEIMTNKISFIDQAKFFVRWKSTCLLIAIFWSSSRFGKLPPKFPLCEVNVLEGGELLSTEANGAMASAVGLSTVEVVEVVVVEVDEAEMFESSILEM